MTESIETSEDDALPFTSAPLSSPSGFYRKKPVVIQAVKITAADFNGREFDGSPFNAMPDWLVTALEKKEITIHKSQTDYAMWRINTLEDGENGEAKHIAGPGDWIICGIKGELYPCKNDIFEATYEDANLALSLYSTKTQDPKYEIFNGRLINAATGIEIPEDEPLFIFRAKDKHAAGVIGDYAQFCNNRAHAEAVNERFIQFSEWAEAHPERMKEPDSAKG